MKERIKLDDKFEPICLSCIQNQCYTNCKKPECIKYGVCQNCKNYGKDYHGICEKKCIFFGNHKNFPVTVMKNVEFICSPLIKKYIDEKYSHSYTLPFLLEEKGDN